MTREEAKEILTHNWTRVDNPNYSESELDEAFFLAIEALSLANLKEEFESADVVQGWNNHEVACMLAELFGDVCACNYNGIDEWLPFVCDLKDSCPNTVGVACWEQFLKHYKERRE